LDVRGTTRNSGLKGSFSLIRVSILLTVAALVTASAGINTAAAGDGLLWFGYSGDGGPATAARLNQPNGVVVDSSGNIYIADTVNHRIRKVTASTGIITTVAGSSTIGNGSGLPGNGAGGYSGDGGPATAAELDFPEGVAVDGSGNIYIADNGNNRIRKVTASTGIITTVAGIGKRGYSGDGGAATAARVYAPFGVALDSSGNIYIAEFGNSRIRKVTVSTGIITTVAGIGGIGTDADNGAITNGVIITDAVKGTTGTLGYSGDGGDGGAATAAQLEPWGVALDSSRNIYIADVGSHVALDSSGNGNIRGPYTGGHCVRKVTASTGKISTVAGTYSGDDKPGSSPTGVAVDSSGNIYIADSGHCGIRKVTVSTGMISTVAGNSMPCFSARAAGLTCPICPRGVAVDGSGNIYGVDDSYIRKVTVSTGKVSTVAGRMPPVTTGTPLGSH
jgi:sugar lactone lactonase YvrE